MSALRTIAILEDDAPESVDLSSHSRFDDQPRPQLPDDLGLYRFLEEEEEPGERPKMRARRRVVRSARRKHLRKVSLV